MSYLNRCQKPPYVLHKDTKRLPFPRLTYPFLTKSEFTQIIELNRKFKIHIIETRSDYHFSYCVRIQLEIPDSYGFSTFLLVTDRHQLVCHDNPDSLYHYLRSCGYHFKNVDLGFIADSLLI